MARHNAKTRKKPAPAKAARPVGRPLGFESSFCERARKLCLLGLTDGELADHFEVSESTINKWKVRFPKFLQSINAGREPADAEVAASLYKRATGYTRRIVKTVDDSDGKQLVHVTEEEVAPDALAAQRWLHNRQRRRWRDPTEEGLNGAFGGLATILASIDGQTKGIDQTSEE
jgi:hypothetical protein